MVDSGFGYFSVNEPGCQFETFRAIEWWSWVRAQVAVFVLKSRNVSDYFSGAFKMILFPGTGRGSIADFSIRLVCNVGTKRIRFQSSRARIGFIVGILALTRVGVAQFACLDVVILYGGREDNVQTRVRSSQVLLICTTPAVLLAAERTFARHGWTLLSRSWRSQSV